MNNQLDRASWYAFIPGYASLGVLLISTAVILAWIFDVPAFQYIFPSLPKMTFNTAVILLASAMALWLYQSPSEAVLSRQGRRRLAIVLALLVTALGLLTLVEYLFDLDFGIDQLLIEDLAGAGETTIPGRPSPHTSITAFFIGLSLILSYWDTKQANGLAQFTVLSAAFTPNLALTGYVFSISYFFRISAYTGMALHSAVGFLILCIGLLFLRPDSGLVYLLTARYVGNVMARRFLLAAVFVPFVVGSISILGERAGLYDTQFEPVMLAVLSAYSFAAVTWWYANTMNRLDIERRYAEEQFRQVVETSPNAIVVVHPEGTINLVNAEVERLFGYNRSELLDQLIDLLIPEQFRSGHNADMQAFFERPEVRSMGNGRDLYGLHKDGRQIPIEIGLSPITTNEGNFVLASIIDITERKKAAAEIAQALAGEKAARIELSELNEELEERVVERTRQLELANQEMEAFSYSVSHDLRAPLRSIDGFSQALLEDYGSSLDEDGKHYLNRVRAGSQRMGQLIDDLLELSRLSRREIAFGMVNLSLITAEIAERMQQVEPERAVTFDIAPNLVAKVDSHLMRIALENLLANAWKFTSKKVAACIEFKATELPDGQRAFFIRDNGAGFDMTYADKLFGAFQRLHSASEFSGTGIGLATVQRVINRHNGRIWAEGAVDQGAVFYFTIGKL